MDKFVEKTIQSDSLFKGKIISLQVDEVMLPNGKISKREIVKHPGAVAIIAMTPEGKIVLVKQYRKALERTIVEIPAGKLENGEEPMQTAIRELEEETGYTCEKMEWITSFYTSPGFANEIVHLFLALNITIKENKAPLDEDEFIQVIELSIDEAVEFVKEKKIYDAKTAYAVQFLQLREALTP